MTESHNVEEKKIQNNANCLIPFYIKFKNRHNQPMVLEVKMAINFREKGESGH